MIDFPASPTDGQIFSATNGVVYKYSATYTSWLAQNPAPPLGGTGDFCANQTSSFPALTASYQTLIPPTVLTGNSGLWYSTSTGRYTPPAGRYAIYASMTVTSTGGSNISFAIRKNGVLVESTNQTATANGWGSPSLSVILDANGSDWFDIQAAQSAGGTTISLIAFQAFPLTGMQGPTGPAGVTQTVFFETGAVATGTTLIPYDDTIPQQTEGDQYMALSITPQSATSKLIIEVIWWGACSVALNMIVALFQDSNANALATVSQFMPAGNSPSPVCLRHTMTSGTTSLTTFKVRAGSNNANTTTFNGWGGSRFFGGSAASSIVIREVP